jgi:hypothetical protein
MLQVSQITRCQIKQPTAFLIAMAAILLVAGCADYAQYRTVKK